ncbi:hypothetical protein MNR02_05110 [Shinella sp. H4-D48]|uniref:hypothetical protein n=1 Tax=Shinella sp. H4-D48 TaxID=2925841 RepID=UPI001F52E638|nr:hypothetical protein [Shinella sp. H4-D48]UNK39086.1 hypothetical protein MNR02_05110 [Shinella sp. H4-D48]
MKAIPLSIATMLALSTAAVAADGDRYTGQRDDAPRGGVVVSEGARMMTAWDYFFNNPEKYHSMRNGPGEYHVGGMRR